MKLSKKALALSFSVVLGALAFTGCANDAQNVSNTGGETVYKIGISQFADHPSLDNCREGFLQGLAQEGFIEGENLDVELQSARTEMAVANQISQKFASEKDLICAIATPTAQAAYSAAAGKVPVIYSAVADPAAAKLLDENGKNLPGITGTSDLLPVEKQLQMIRAFLPDAKKIGILYTTSEANSVSQLNLYKQYAPQYGFEIVEKGVGKQADVPLATDALLSQVDCLSNLTDNTVVSALAVILEKAGAKKIPVFGSEEEQVANGCLASEGIDYVKLGVQTGVMAAKVLKGEKAEDIPYEIIKEYVFVVNQKTLNDLGLTLTPEQQQRAQLVG